MTTINTGRQFGKTKLQAAIASMSPDMREAFLEHLRGGTSANWLSDWLSRYGHPVSPTSIKEQRRSL